MRLQKMLALWLSVCCALLALDVRAEVALPSFFSDHMVLQRGETVPVWGKAKAGEKVTVSFRTQKLEATAGEDGAWKVELAALKAGGPDDLSIAGENTVTIKDVLVGEVWFCSGQSNMQWSVNNSNNAKEEIAAANYPLIREFQTKRVIATEPQSDISGTWKVCSPKEVPRFSAVGYYFGRELHQKLNVPIGLIHSSWGGTPAQAWTSMERLKSDENQKRWVDLYEKALKEYPEKKAKFDEMMKGFNKKVQAAKAEGKKPPRRPRGPLGPTNPHLPSGLYNAMVAPFIPYRIKGAIWYQGESNAGAHENYRTLFPLMITDWRTRWGQGDFPFLFVQLANFKDRQAEPSDEPWPFLRDAQTETLKLPATGMAVIIDIGEAKDIHPKNKQDVGKRLALAARANTYGEKDLVYSGPMFKAAAFDGGKAVVSFTHVGGGLEIKGGEELKGFALAGEDKKWHWAKAAINGETVVVASEAVATPVAVRYGWANNPEVNLYNKEGLPASPFRSDDWPRGAK